MMVERGCFGTFYSFESYDYWRQTDYAKIVDDRNGSLRGLLVSAAAAVELIVVIAALPGMISLPIVSYLVLYQVHAGHYYQSTICKRGWQLQLALLLSENKLLSTLVEPKVSANSDQKTTKPQPCRQDLVMLKRLLLFRFAYKDLLGAYSCVSTWQSHCSRSSP